MTPYLAQARHRWPKTEWIIGNGRYASVSECPPRPTVMLFQSEAEADTANRFINRTGCGGRCEGNHAVVALTPEGITGDGDASQFEARR